MNINKLRTSRRSVLVMTALFAMFGIVLSLSVSAITELLSGEADQSVNAQTDNTVFEDYANSVPVGAGPVNITLINRGEVSMHEYFPVECSVFLKNEGIELSGNDVLNVSKDTVLSENLIIDIEKVEFVTETRTERVPFEVIDCPVQTIPKGTREVTQAGIDGEAERTYIVKYINGQKAEEVLYSEKVINIPVEEIANVGVGGTVTGKDGKTYNFSYYKQMEATAYTYVPGLTTMTTATGRRLQKGIIAVDPRVIPLHTKLFVTSDKYEYGYGEAEDTGGVIKGNIVDLAFMSYDECIQFGRRQMIVYILE